MSDGTAHPWWQDAVVYQVYPRSFLDSNGDGVGDLPGIISKLDYIASLGVDVIWLNPVYESPNVDNGYDIADYRAIMPEFGTMADWERLLEEMHARGLRMVMDLVVNHTSDQHAWFTAARGDPAGPYREYYVWREGRGADGHEPPNNWESFFGGPAWEWDSSTRMYYLHLFAPEQPDLNWEHPPVRREIYDMMRWWFDKGVDGFRMDVINLISKDQRFPDDPAPKAQYRPGSQYFINGPRVHEFLREMRREVLNDYDVMTVGECIGAGVEDALRFTNLDGSELNMLIHFEMMELDHGPGGKWDIVPLRPDVLRECETRWQEGVDGRAWVANYLSNHDQPRPVSRFGDDGRYRLESAKMLAVLNMCRQGTPFVFAGEEIGMTNVAFPRIEDYRDVETLNHYAAGRARGRDPEELLREIHLMSRDNGRTPMQWDDSTNAGFTTGTPWIGVNPNYTSINVAAAETDSDSILHFYRRLIALRRELPPLRYGSFLRRDAAAGEDGTFAFERRLGEDAVLVVLNLTADPAIGVEVPAHRTLLLANYGPASAPDRAGAAASTEDIEIDAHGLDGRGHLRPFEARIYEVG
ncbi:MAG: alpha-glucosidase [Spirochaetaceae bacterium]